MFIQCYHGKNLVASIPSGFEITCDFPEVFSKALYIYYPNTSGSVGVFDKSVLATLLLGGGECDSDVFSFVQVPCIIARVSTFCNKNSPPCLQQG
jgi:hypothetical protein